MSLSILPAFESLQTLEVDRKYEQQNILNPDCDHIFQIFAYKRPKSDLTVDQRFFRL